MITPEDAILAHKFFVALCLVFLIWGAVGWAIEGYKRWRGTWPH